jgi:hypothetical protein
LIASALALSSPKMKGIDCISALKALGELSRLRIMRLLLKEQLGVRLSIHSCAYVLHAS